MREIATGEKFNRLTVVNFSHKVKSFNWFTCQCDCGKVITRRQDHLLRTNNQSCGCLKKEINKRTHTKHGLSGDTPEYQAWAHMLRRCYTPTTKGFENYGGRGITVCDRWRFAFENFLNDMGYRPSRQYSLDRINNDGNYEPSNCRWATAKEQCNNTRRCRMLTFNNETLTIAQWSEKLGFNRGVLLFRIRRGWSVEKALLTPTGLKASRT
jgi:hypothetical protein